MQEIYAENGKNLYLFFLYFTYLSFYSAAHRTVLMNSGRENLTSMLIRETNDLHLAEVIHNIEIGSSVDKVNYNRKFEKKYNVNILRTPPM